MTRTILILDRHHKNGADEVLYGNGNISTSTQKADMIGRLANQYGKAYSEVRKLLLSEQQGFKDDRVSTDQESLIYAVTACEYIFQLSFNPKDKFVGLTERVEVDLF